MWKIAKIGDYETTDFAASELKRYLNKIDPSNDYMMLDCKKYDAERKDVLWVGYTPEFPVPEVEDAKFDDGISISVKKNAGYITGTNGRSVLIAVYRFLRELGCGFVRPGEKGEVIPTRELKDVDVKIFEKASYRHRVMCIDGDTSYDNIIDMVDWLPKVGMNAFLNQYHLLYGNYSRWYNGETNPMYKGETFTRADAIGMRTQTLLEMKRRGLVNHSGGHKWTNEPFGVEACDWDKSMDEVPEKLRQNIALMNGKREFFKSSTIDTNLCYTTKYVQDELVKAAVEFCKENPYTEILHFWLGDGCNNQCECENCQKYIPSDLYIDILNRIDEALTKENIDVKISLVVYDDLLWTPAKSRIKNTDRFILHYAPITRGFYGTLADAEEFEGEIPPYVRNKLNFPTKNSELVAHLKNWQAIFDGDSYDFDYHFMWEHFVDFGYFDIGKVLFDDIVGLKKLNLNGFITCQSMRCFLPSSLPMIGMAEALWNREADFDTVADRYFYSAFGADGDKVKAYLQEISEIINLHYLNKVSKTIISRENEEKYENILARIDSFVPVIKAHAADSELCEAQRLSWKYLIYHAELCKIAANCFLLLVSGEIEKATEKLEELKAYPKSVLSEIHDVFDDSLFVYTMKDRTSGLWYRANKLLEEKNRKAE